MAENGALILLFYRINICDEYLSKIESFKEN